MNEMLTVTINGIDFTAAKSELEKVRSQHDITVRLVAHNYSFATTAIVTVERNNEVIKPIKSTFVSSLALFDEKIVRKELGDAVIALDLKGKREAAM